MCGAAKPTKPINPVNAIIREVINAEIINIFFLTTAGFTPVEIAKSSPPNANVFRSQEYFINAGNMAPRITPTQSTVTKFGLETLPNDQCVSWASC